MIRLIIFKINILQHENIHYSLLTRLQNLSSTTIANLMALFFFLEYLVGEVIMWALPELFWDGEGNYWLATAHPFTRLPVFLMGVCAGILCNRLQTGDLDAYSKIITYMTSSVIPYC